MPGLHRENRGCGDAPAAGRDRQSGGSGDALAIAAGPHSTAGLHPTAGAAAAPRGAARAASATGVRAVALAVAVICRRTAASTAAEAAHRRSAAHMGPEIGRAHV